MLKVFDLAFKRLDMLQELILLGNLTVQLVENLPFLFVHDIVVLLIEEDACLPSRDE